MSGCTRFSPRCSPSRTPTWRSSTPSLGICVGCSPFNASNLPLEIQQNIDMESYRIQQTGSGKVTLERKGSALDPVGD